MSVRSRQIQMLRLKKKYALLLLLSAALGGSLFAGNTLARIMNDKEISERNSSIAESVLEVSENEVPVVDEVKEETTEEEIVEEPHEYYSSEYLDSGYEFSDWTTFNQIKLLGLEGMTFEEITEKYPDIVGGIEVPGTNIKNFIVRSPNEDRDYYLHKDLNGNYFYDGIVYENNSFVSLKEPRYNQGCMMTLFGHNLNGYESAGSYTRLQFHDFQNYLTDSAYADDHNKVFIYYLDGTVGVGELYSVVRFVRDETGLQFINPTINNEQEFYTYADLLKSLSEVDTNVYPDYEAGDQLICCQTCSHMSTNGLMLVTFVVPNVKQITCEEQRYLLEENEQAKGLN